MDKEISESLSTSFSLALSLVSEELNDHQQLASEFIWQPSADLKHATYTSEQVTATTMAQHSMVATATTSGSHPYLVDHIQTQRQPYKVLKATIIGIAGLTGFHNN